MSQIIKYKAAAKKRWNWDKRNKHKFVQKVAKKNILLISFKFSTKQGQTR